MLDLTAINRQILSLGESAAKYLPSPTTNKTMFKITIEEIKTVTKIEKGQYGIIGEEQRDDNDVEYEKRHRPENPSIHKPVWGYPPEREVESTSTAIIYTQQVADMDLATVIKAMNRM